ncbi:MAG: hypothetical protein DRJ55_04680 [Thermoprotei archaeon]|nr:MAG: hypothetical protein DRJ55_04680 [Thermoprotei archaeon]
MKEYQEYKDRLIELFKILKSNPIPYKKYDVAKLKGYRNTYRIRLGKLRVIYEVDWAEKP